jgi:hypothetical protein
MKKMQVRQGCLFPKQKESEQMRNRQTKTKATIKLAFNP